jgi:5-(carboxyamino)imidazole ribonucleotide synthase
MGAADVVGVLGGGQLGRMIALCAARLGVRVRCFDPSPSAVAGQVCELLVGEYADEDRLARFAHGLIAATLEFENVPAAALLQVAARVPTFPGAAALSVCQDRLEEKGLFRRLSIGTAAYAAVSTREDLDAAVARLGLPLVLKTARGGYDGKGQAVLRAARDVERGWFVLGEGRVRLIAEALVPFEREVSIIAARGRDGATVCYPLCENHHAGGVLRLTLAPAPGADARLQARAESIARAVLDALDYVGVLCVELFEVGGELLANEVAPRVHNSGHWTIEGCAASQFENHVRAVVGLPLGDARAGSGGKGGHAAMVNLVGGHPPLERLCGLPGACVHLYGKEVRPGRKVGHVTLLDADPVSLARRVAEVRAVVEPTQA